MTSSGRSQSIEGYADANRALDIANFQVSIEQENGELTVHACPEGQEATDQHRSDKTGLILVHFKSDVCKVCNSCDRCPVTIGVNISTLKVNEAQYAGVERHQQYMGDVEYRKEYGIRTGAESLVNEVVNGHDCRQSRHRNETGSRNG